MEQRRLLLSLLPVSSRACLTQMTAANTPGDLMRTVWRLLANLVQTYGTGALTDCVITHDINRRVLVQANGSKYELQYIV